jgi:2-dehydro-3-deoxygalactonokinase
MRAGGGGITVIGRPALAAALCAGGPPFRLPCTVLDPHQVYCAPQPKFFL